MAKVSLNKAGKDLYAAVQRAIEATAPGLIQPGDCVLIKPNLVMPQAPDSNEITNPLLIEAVARYCLDSGANRVIIGEGPGCINRKSQLKECFVSSGVIEIAGRLGVDWVLFDDHGYRSFKDISDCTPAEFRVTEYAFSCDKIINLAALKTHYLTTVTLAMKNLKGFLKYEDKPLFHQPDIHRAIVELNKIIRPSFNIIDATHWKHGGGLLIAGTDIVAVDSAGCALMGIDPSSIRMISLGADRGLGEKYLTRIEIVGEELKQLKFKVKLPREELREFFPQLEIKGAGKACSGCLIPVISGLMLLHEQGLRLEKPLTLYMGKNPAINPAENYIVIGDCALAEGGEHRYFIHGCAPLKEEVMSTILAAAGR